jgi:dienelactone hydrolase
MRKDLTIDLGDVQLDAWHYRPDGAKGHIPTVIMSFGFSGLKAMGLDKFAEVFVEAGLGALVYDHRSFGKSTGMPEREIDPWVQVQDMRKVITFASTINGLDAERIGLWGTSYAGGHTIMVSAIDRRVRCAVAQVPFISGKVSIEGLIPSYLRPTWFKELAKERQARLNGAKPTYVPVAVDPEEQVKGEPYRLGLVDAREPGFAWLSEAGQAAGYQNSVTLTSYDHFYGYEPGKTLSGLAQRRSS